MPFDVEGARKEGYSDSEIAGHLANQSKFDLRAAKAEGYSDSDVIAHLSKQSRVDTIPGVLPRQAPKPTSLLDKAIGAGEAGLSLATGAIGGGIGLAAGALGGIAGGIDTAIRGGIQPQGGINDVALEQAQRFTYQPRTAAGQEQLAAAAPVLANLGAVPPAQMISAAAMAPAVGRQVAAAAPRAIEAAIPRAEFNALRAPFVKDEPQMPGMGAAMTDVATLRNERAQSLPIPINLTRGQLERSFEQQKFERETAKLGKPGEPLRQRFAEQNEQILRNFDAWVDETGAQAPDLRATGQVVNQAIVDKAKKAKGEIDAAYTQARASGEMADPINVEPLLQYAQKKRAAANNAGVISSLESAINEVAGPRKEGAPRTVTLNDLEEIRSMVGTAGLKDAPNGHYAREIKTLIDSLTEGVGGEAYTRARMLRYRYGKEFENVGVVDKLMSTKPGTTDRAVAYEDVFKHSILSGSLDDVRAVRRTLRTAGPNGEQAWKELQGQTVQHLKDAASRNAQRDIRNNPVVSFAGLDKAIKELDRDGKLDFIFGQQGAQKLRDIREIAADAVTAPPGSVNTSNTASALLEAAAAGLVGKLPTMAAKATGAMKDFMAERKLRTQVNAALNPFPANPEQPVTGLAQLLRRQ